MQTMGRQLGGETEAADAREYGHAEVTLVAADRLFEGLEDPPGAPPRLAVWMSHGDHVSTAPPGFTVTARTERVPVSAFSHAERPWYGSTDERDAGRGGLSTIGSRWVREHYKKKKNTKHI